MPHARLHARRPPAAGPWHGRARLQRSARRGWRRRMLRFSGIWRCAPPPTSTPLCSGRSPSWSGSSRRWQPRKQPRPAGGLQLLGSRGIQTACALPLVHRCCGEGRKFHACHTNHWAAHFAKPLSQAYSCAGALLLPACCSFQRHPAAQAQAAVHPGGDSAGQGRGAPGPAGPGGASQARPGGGGAGGRSESGARVAVGSLGPARQPPQALQQTLADVHALCAAPMPCCRGSIRLQGADALCFQNPKPSLHQPTNNGCLRCRTPASCWTAMTP